MGVTAYPLPRETRESTILVGDGTVGPFGPSLYRIFDTADVSVWAKADGEDFFSDVTASVTVTKTNDLGYDTFSITFDDALPASTEWYHQAARVAERSVAVTKAGSIDSDQLEKELSKQASALSEIRRDLGRAVRMDGLGASPIMEDIEPGHFWKRGDNGQMVDGGSAADIGNAEANAAIATQKAGEAVAAADAAVAAAGSVAVKYAADDTALQALTGVNDKAMFNLANEGWWLPTSDDISAEITAADPRYLPTSGDATGASGGFYQAGSVGTGSFFETDSTPARIHRVNDRILLGDATDYDGSSSLVTGTGSWLWDIGATSHMGWVELNARFASVSSRGIGVTGAVQQTLSGGSAIGGVFYADNNRAAGTSTADKGYGSYTEARQGNGAGNTAGNEIDITKLAASSSGGLTPYAPTPVGHAVSLRLASGGDANVNPVTYDAEAALQIINNGAKFLAGIVLGDNALTRDGGTTGRAHATRLAYDTAMEWYEFTTKTLGFSVVSQIQDAGHKQELRASNAGLDLLDDAGITLFRSAWVDNANSGISLVSSASNSPAITPVGSSSDIILRIYPKGTQNAFLLDGAQNAKFGWGPNGIGVFGHALAGQASMAAATGTAKRTTFDTASVTLPELAGVVMALISDSRGWGWHA